MNLEEHAAKDKILKPAGVPIPRGRVCTTPQEAAAAVGDIGPSVVKAQVPTGKRGKAGGIKMADQPSEGEAAAREILGMSIGGNRVERVYDVGVAGLHRLLRKLEIIQSANVIVAVAGMEGALPSVVCGLVSKPVIAVPTSVGYGAHLGGFTALLAMLNSCSSGLTVVNINNGFGAGFAASQINALAAGELK